MLTGRWFWSDRTLAQSPVSSFDQGEIVWCDWTLRGERPDDGCPRPVDTSKVLERENRDRTLAASGHTVITGFRGVVTGASGQHDRSVWSPHRGT